jgi:excisionase family DNA binding protein
MTDPSPVILNQSRPSGRPFVQPLAHSPDSAARALDVPVRTIYRLIASGELKSFKIGKRRLIGDPELERLVARKTAEAA